MARRSSLLVSSLLVVIAGCGTEPGDVSGVGDVAVRGTALAEPAVIRSERPVAGQYIVVLRDRRDPGAEAARLLPAGGQLLHVYRAALRGFAARMSEPAAAALARNPNVAWVEEDGVFEAIATTQAGATWGIDRVDQRTLPLSTTYGYEATGSGVHAFVIDTGIAAHAEFGDRLAEGAYFVYDGHLTNDCNGHGTHVSGTIGSRTYGVAKGVFLHPVRVLDCGGSGTTSAVIAGVDWVTASEERPAVANMSLGGGASTSLDQAVANSIADGGVTYAIAAGNNRADACRYSPARVPAALTVGATTSTDAMASYSNYGTCVDLLAPGSAITSTWLGGSTNTISGTSMATPHVAGAVALYLEGHPNATTGEIALAVVNDATRDVLTGLRTGTANRLLYAYSLGGGALTVTPPPTLSPPPGTFKRSVTVTITDYVLPATIHYTTDGSDPEGSTTRTSCAAPCTRTLTATTTINARAEAGDLALSPMVSGTYTRR